MSHDYETYEEYWNKIQSIARMEYEETVDWYENEGMEFEPDDFELIRSAAEYGVEGSHLLMYHHRTIIYHADHGFNGEGHERFVAHREFDGEPREMLRALASAAMFNDVLAAIENLVEYRDDLGEAYKLIADDTPYYADGVTFEYEYERGITEPATVTYTLESIGNTGNEWKIIDPDGRHFETISPHVMVEDDPMPERIFGIKLDNLCAKQELQRKREGRIDE